ncbi:AraC family transcriptional regulator [Bacteroidia bacterium]|nr:AraC family transcriptional regulator [Bacteroidia bacterium]GHT26542.1 AraC family transcriptional regulator [Bacteroidia bacterium]GHV71082.1 AraC family transcriptional regulator [Bacteroidia bacterium]
MYHEYKPDIRLTPFVETYWITVGFLEKATPFKVLPDGCADIVFTFDDDAGNDNSVEIVGTMTAALNLVFSGNVRMFGIRFRPAGISAFTRVSVEEFTNYRLDATLVETLLDRHFFEVLQQKHTVEDVVCHVDNYLISKLPCLYQVEKQIVRAVDLIYLAKGQISPVEIASEVCLCQRHFERKFRAAIGISPKTFSKIVRFKNALKCLKNTKKNDLLTVAVNCGYYDHTHLIKDFKAFSGEAPSYFK